jgi:phosphatidyl-myo-inositol alpha-mannosyltransferase
MKIALVLESTFDSDAGVQQYFKGLGRYLLKQGHDVRFLATYASDNSEFGKNVYSTGRVFNPFLNTTSVPIGIYSSTSRVKKILEEEHFDVVHVGIPVSPFSMSKVIKHASCPVVGTFMIHTQSDIQRIFTKQISRFPINVSRYIDWYTAPNEKTRKEASGIIPGDYQVIPHATEAAQYRSSAKPLPKFADGKKNILFLGRLENRKGVHLLLQIFPDVMEKIKDVRLIIAGDGPMRKELEKTADDLGITSHVSFEGYIDENLKANYFASADLCVFPATHGECFGIVLIECLSYGKIPVAFANEGYGSVLENLPDVLVENRNLDELTSRIVHFLTNDKERKRSEKACLNEASKFSWDHVGPQFEKIYTRISKPS